MSIINKIFGSWNAIRGLMAAVLIGCIISVGISAYQYKSDGNGVFTQFAPFNNWEKGCQTSPFLYMAPFSFSYSYGSTTSTGYCGWSEANSAFRLAIACFSILMVPVLFFNTVVSYFASMIILTLSLLWFCALVLDSDSYELGILYFIFDHF